MKIPISKDTSFEAFVQQIKDRQEAVALQNPYTDIQIVAIAENLIENTGFYTMDCREWNRTDNAQKTWVNFKVHFLQAFQENQAQHAGYGHTNTQNLANAAILAEITQDHSHALANLATDEYQKNYLFNTDYFTSLGKIGVICVVPSFHLGSLRYFFFVREMGLTEGGQG